MDLHAKIAKTTKIATVLVCFGLVSGLVYKVYQWRQNVSAEQEALRRARQKDKETRQADKKANREASQARFDAMANDLKLTQQKLDSVLASNFDKTAQEAMTKQSSELMNALKQYIESDSAQDVTTKEQMKSIVILVEQQKNQIQTLQNAANNDETKLNEISNTQKSVMDQITALVTAQLNAGATKIKLQELLIIVNALTDCLPPNMVDGVKNIDNNPIASIDNNPIANVKSSLVHKIAAYNQFLSNEIQRIGILEGTLSGLKANLLTLEATLSQENANLSSLQANLSNQTEDSVERASIQASIAASEHNIESLNAQIASTKASIAASERNIELDKRSFESSQPLMELMSRIAQEILEAINLYDKNNITNEGFFSYFATFYATLTKKHENKIAELQEIESLNPLQEGEDIMRIYQDIKPILLILKLKQGIEAKIAQL